MFHDVATLFNEEMSFRAENYTLSLCGCDLNEQATQQMLFPSTKLKGTEKEINHNLRPFSS